MQSSSLDTLIKRVNSLCLRMLSYLGLTQGPVKLEEGDRGQEEEGGWGQQGMGQAGVC